MDKIIAPMQEIFNQETGDLVSRTYLTSVESAPLIETHVEVNVSVSEAASAESALVILQEKLRVIKKVLYDGATPVYPTTEDASVVGEIEL